MERILRLNIKVVLAIFLFIDLLCVGLGMGVPIFCILLGFPFGWYIARREAIAAKSVKGVFNNVFIYAIIISAFTFVLMSIIWGSTFPLLFDPGGKLENFGIPLILYEPKASFIGWHVLMIFISPFLQLLTTVFTSYVTLLRWLNSYSSGV